MFFLNRAHNKVAAASSRHTSASAYDKNLKEIQPSVPLLPCHSQITAYKKKERKSYWKHWSFENEERVKKVTMNEGERECGG